MRAYLISTRFFLSILSLGHNLSQIVDTTKTWNTFAIGNATRNAVRNGGTMTTWYRDITGHGIYASDGKLIRNLVFSSSVKPDLSRLSHCLYLVRILDGEGNALYNERIVKGK